ncbi:YdeI/OmpD-associated family protein [Segnochrobactrum spirostomi]|uniref:YdhG-like domain-containing protein n=1 Tax=Segnochrobactrum spirostomi TaxID=2608987 RepID=A0A6A7Y208_9HYPH|nr:YdeI/OmpD-associated family protein [Segnochrobactrum spirostomi]MQT11889.1 hypothetical protein [Segnochrobactrum spirostomi]
MITDVEDFFTQGCGRCERFATPDCSARVWSPGLLELRRICHAVGLAEAVKWGHPCYGHAGRNIVLIGAVRGDFRLIFMNAALMRDPMGLLERQGPNTRHPDMMRFTAATDVAARAPIIAAYLKEAMGHAEAGLKPPKEDWIIELPEDLVEAMEADPDLASAFAALTPGRQRSYVLAVNGAKTQATRLSRIAAFRPKILAGKGATER